MKPTQEQVIAWAREAGDCLVDKRGREDFIFDSYGIERFAALAYEAGRKDENEACAKVCEAEEQRILSKQSGRDFDPVDTNLRMIACVLPDIAAAIRARREQ